MRIGMLVSRIRVEEKLLFKEFEKRGTRGGRPTEKMLIERATIQ